MVTDASFQIDYFLEEQMHSAFMDILHQVLEMVKKTLPSLSSLLPPSPRTQKKILDGFGRFEFEGGAINLTMTVIVS